MPRQIHPRGQRRREMRDSIAFGRAQFEREYEGKPIVPCDRAYVVGDLHSRGLIETTAVSDGFVRDVRRRVPYFRRLLDEFGDES